MDPSTARARRAAINANVILWHDQMIFRCHERHHGTMSWVLPRRSGNNDERIASLTASAIPLWQLVFSGGEKKNTRQVRISMIYFLLIPFTSDKNILSMLFYFIFIYYRIPIYHSLNILYFIYVYRSILRRKYLFYILIFCESFRDKK